MSNIRRTGGTGRPQRTQKTEEAKGAQISGKTLSKSESGKAKAKGKKAGIKKAEIKQAKKGTVSKEAKALKKDAHTLAKRLVKHKKNPTKFNDAWDHMKKKTGDKRKLRRAFVNELNTLSNADLRKLASIPDLNLRGWNREGVKTLFRAARQVSKERGLNEEARVLGNRIKAYTSITEVRGELRDLAAGAVNVVKIGTFVRPDGTTFEGVFKADPSNLSAGTYIRESLFGTAKLAGIPVGAKSHLPERAIATDKVDKLLFGEDGVCVKTEYAIIEGQRGIIMEVASGGSPKMTGTTKRELSADNPEEKKIMDVFNKLSLRVKVTKQSMRFFAAMLGARKVKVSNGKLVRVDAKFENFDPKNVKTIKGLLMPEVLDRITGQVDRHIENYFVGDDGTVTAIDSDCAFGVKALPKKGDVRKQRGIVPNNASLMLRMPPVLTRDIANKVLNLTLEQLKAEIGGHISEKEMAATKDRLEKLQAHIGSDKCKIVNKDEDLLKAENQKLMDANNSYYRRELDASIKNPTNWNHLRVIPKGAKKIAKIKRQIR